MDVDFRSLAICLVGYSMAAAGFLLSVTFSVITAIVPPLQPQTTQETYEILRRRIQNSPGPGDEKRKPNAPLTSAQHVVASDAASADSMQSFNSAPSEPSTCHRATSTPPTSLANSPESQLRPLPQASPTPHGKVEQHCTSTAWHVCTPQKCSNPASSSAVSETSIAPVPRENTEKSRKSSDGEGMKSKNIRAMRAVSWLKGSPSSPPSSLFQFTPRSSGECSRVPLSESPTRAVTFDEFDHEISGKKEREPRRATTLLPFKRFSKTPARVDSVSVSDFSGSATTTIARPVPEGRRSEPTSPKHTIRTLPDVFSDAEVSGRENKRRMSYFARLKRRVSAKEPGKVVGQQEVSERDNTVMSARRPSEPFESNNSDRGRSRDKPFAQGLCELRRRPATAPTAERPSRTNPYEAPYFFPTPISPEAVDYVRLAKTERRRTSISPTRIGAGSDGGAPRQIETRSQTQTQHGFSSAEQNIDGGKSSSSMNPGSVPQQYQHIRHATFAVSIPASTPSTSTKGGHVRSGSVSSSSPTEFGFVRPSVNQISSQEKGGSRTKRFGRT